jgi:hypothetical protein
MSNFPVLLGAVVIDASNRDIVLEYDDGALQVVTLSIPNDTYYVRGDGTASDLCKAFADTLTASASTNTFTCDVVTSTGADSWDTNPANVSAKVVVDTSAGSQNWRVRWNHASATFDPALFGFATEKGAANTTKEISTLSPSPVWVANDQIVDALPGAEWAAVGTRIASGDSPLVRRSDKFKTRDLLLQYIDGRRLWLELNTGDPTATLESFIELHNDGRKIELHEQALASSSVTTLSALSSSTRKGVAWRFSEESASSLRPTRRSLGLDLWDHTLSFTGAV